MPITGIIIHKNIWSDQILKVVGNFQRYVKLFHLFSPTSASKFDLFVYFVFNFLLIKGSSDLW